MPDPTAHARNDAQHPDRGPGVDTDRRTLPHDRDQIEAFNADVQAAAERHGFDATARFAIRLAVEEAVTNAFKHGHKNLPDDTPVEASYAVTDDRVEVTVHDRGPGFDPGGVPDPTLDENLEIPSGRGLMLIRAYMSSVEHSDNGRRVRMVFDRR